MCLSTIYKETKAPENIVMGNVQRIDIDGDQILLTDLMDRQVVVIGQLVMVDLVGSTAIVREF